MDSTIAHSEIALRGDRAVYMAAGGELQLDVRIDSETIWLTQAQLAELFDVDVRTVSEHLVNIYGAGELEREATIRNFRMVRKEGRRTVERSIGYYSLDAVISVGYRVNSKTATAFRQSICLVANQPGGSQAYWATSSRPLTDRRSTKASRSAQRRCFTS